MLVTIRMLSIFVAICMAYAPLIQVLGHNDCIYSKAVFTLLDWSGTKYEKLEPAKNMHLLVKDTHIPKVYVDNVLIGGYHDSLNKWKFVYRMLPLEPEPSILKDPKYVVAKYGNTTNKSALNNIER